MLEKIKARRLLILAETIEDYRNYLNKWGWSMTMRDKREGREAIERLERKLARRTPVVPVPDEENHK